MITKFGHLQPGTDPDFPSLRLEVKHTVSSHFARAHLANAERLGLQRRDLLRAASLSESLLQEGKSRIAPQQLAAMFQTIWREVDDEMLGLTAAPQRVGVFALIAERMVACDTLGDALQQAMRFYHLVSEGVQFSQQLVGDQLYFSRALTRPALDRQHILIELLMLIWHRFPSWLVGRAIPLQEIRFRHPPPAHRDEYPLLYPGPSLFTQSENTLVWPAEVLQWPIRRNPQQLQIYLRQIPLPWFRKQKYIESLSDQVARMMEDAPEEQLITLDEIARQLHMTSRTLRRKLTREGSRFQQMKDELRRDRAIYWLSQQNIGIAEVGRRSGYTEPTAFMRAFRSWTGMSPGSYRKRLLATK